MNSTQRLVLAIAAIAIAAMIAYPPFQIGTEFSFSTTSRGYAFIGDPPLLGKINFAMLLLQCGGASVLAGVLFFISKGK